MLDGMFSFVLLDTSSSPSRVLAARDPIGITTLYMGHHSSSPSTVFFASEMKCIQDECDVLQAFPPGHFYDSNVGKVERYFKPSWWNTDLPGGERATGELDYEKIRTSLEAAVKKRLMSEVPYGVLLSGGLDSSLIASIAARETDKMAKQQEEAAKERKAALAEGREARTFIIYEHIAQCEALSLGHAPKGAE
jgi:asparagine synthase (glutamine-hydrolysing)